ncbi:MAG: DUF1848 domain-containing protein [Clostridia bacterium]
MMDPILYFTQKVGKKMVLSASRRTDIPCCYSEWFMNRLREGFAYTRNPMNPAQLSRIPLTPEIVDCIVFWTKDAENMLPYLEELDRMGYRYYFQFTVTPYGRTIEKNLRDKIEIEKTFIELSKRIGRERVVWRYDPIVLNETITAVSHKEQFRRLCETLSSYTERVILSYVDLYAKLKTPLLREISQDEMAELSSFIGTTAKEYGLVPQACCEQHDLSRWGIGRASCIDRELIGRICGEPLAIPPDRNQRSGCGCVQSVDIGAYDTCRNGCIYCYANARPETARRRFSALDPHGPLLADRVAPGETIRERTVKSYRKTF